MKVQIVAATIDGVNHESRFLGEPKLAEDVIQQCADDHRRPWQINFLTAFALSLLVGIAVTKLQDVPAFNFVPGVAFTCVFTYVILNALGVAPGLREPPHYGCYANGQLLRQMETDLSPNDLYLWNRFFASATANGEAITVRMLNAYARQCYNERLNQEAMVDQRGTLDCE